MTVGWPAGSSSSVKVGQPVVAVGAPLGLSGTVTSGIIGGRYPPEQAPDLILGRPAGIKTVIAFDAP